MKRVILYTLFPAIAGLLSAVVIGAMWLFGTTGGARWLLHRATGMASVTMDAQSISGSLYQGLELQNARVAWLGGSVGIGELRLQWNPVPLLAGRISIGKLAMKEVRVIDTKKKIPDARPEGLQWPRIRGLPARVSLRIHELTVRDIRYQKADAGPIIINRISADVRLSHGRLTLRNMDIKTPRFQLQGAASAGFVRLALRMKATLSLGKAVAGMDSFSLFTDLRAAGAQGSGAGPLKISGMSAANEVIRIESVLEMTNRSINLTDLQVARPGISGIVKGQVEVLLTKAEPVVRGELLLSDVDLSRELSMPARVSGTIAIQGTALGYTGRFDLTNSGAAAWQSGRIEVDLRGTKDEIRVTSLRGQWLKGSIEGSARAAWSKTPSAGASLKLRGMNLSAISDGMKGTLNVDVTGTAQLTRYGRPRAEVTARVLNSDVQGHSLAGRLKAGWVMNDLRIDQLFLAGRGYSLRANGRLQQGIGVAARISDISPFLPNAHGAIRVRGTIRKKESRFSGSFDATGRQIAAQNLRAASVQLNGILFDREGLPFSVSLSSRSLSYSGMQLSTLAVDASGTQADHRIRGELRSREYRLETALAGSFENGTWQGAILRFSGNDPQGPWSMVNRTPLTLSRTGISLAPLVIRSRNSEELKLSAAISMNPLSGNFSLSWSAVDLSRANAWMQGLNLSGWSDGVITGTLLPQDRLRVTGTTTLTGASVSRRIQKTLLTTRISKAEAAFDWQGETAEVRLSLALARLGTVNGRLQVPLPARFPVSLNREGQMKGSLKGRVRESGIVAFLFPGLVQESKGQLDADLTIQGTWNAPVLTGSLLLQKAGGYFPAVGIRIADIYLQAQIEQNTIRITALRATSGPGTVRGTAVVRLEQRGISQYEGSLRGEQFQALLLPQMRMQISPDLTFKGTGKALTVRGQILVPELLVYGPPREAPVKASEDVVIAGRQKEQEAGRLETDIEVKVILGKRVIVNARGADAQLGGDVIVAAESADKVKARGTIKVIKGRYSAYGVSLDIERGRVLFSGPVENPSLDILALKTVNEIKAGVVVTGTIKKPLVKLYSYPAMTDADVLSTIVLGRPLGGQNKQQADYLMQAAGALLSAGQSVALQDQMKRRLGVDTIDIESGSGEVGRSLVTIGKYLSPRLYVSYGRSLFTSENVFRLRYKLGRRWEVESHSGETSGVDLFYTVNFD